MKKNPIIFWKPIIRFCFGFQTDTIPIISCHGYIRFPVWLQDLQVRISLGQRLLGYLVEIPQSEPERDRKHPRSTTQHLKQLRSHPKRNHPLSYRDSSRHISREQRGGGHYACVAGSDVTGSGPDRKWRHNRKYVLRMPGSTSPLFWAIPIYYFDIWIWGKLYISHEKLPKDGKVLCHLRFMSKVLPGPLTDVNA
jgi:hypothetical protein